MNTVHSLIDFSIKLIIDHRLFTVIERVKMNDGLNAHIRIRFIKIYSNMKILSIFFPPGSNRNHVFQITCQNDLKLLFQNCDKTMCFRRHNQRAHEDNL